MAQLVCAIVVLMYRKKIAMPIEAKALKLLRPLRRGLKARTRSWNLGARHGPSRYTGRIHVTDHCS
jgi:hypothetical protein